MSAHKENAALIAAAPDLYESCKEMREVCAALFRVIANLELPAKATAIGLLENELKAIGIVNGFGERAQKAVAKADGAAVSPGSK